MTSSDLPTWGPTYLSTYTPVFPRDWTLRSTPQGFRRRRDSRRGVDPRYGRRKDPVSVRRKERPGPVALTTEKSRRRWDRSYVRGTPVLRRPLHTPDDPSTGCDVTRGRYPDYVTPITQGNHSPTPVTEHNPRSDRLLPDVRESCGYLLPVPDLGPWSYSPDLDLHPGSVPTFRTCTYTLGVWKHQDPVYRRRLRSLPSGRRVSRPGRGRRLRVRWTGECGLETQTVSFPH